MKQLITLAILFFLMDSAAAFADMAKIKINSLRVYQGQVLKIQLQDKNLGSFKVKFKGQEYKSFLLGQYQTVVIGINYQLRPGTYTISGIYEVRPDFYAPINYSVRVIGRYPKLKYVPPKRDFKEQGRLNEEAVKKVKVFFKPSWRKEKMDYFARPVLPVHINSEFGNRRCLSRIGKRVFNCRYHLGVDYRAAFDKDHSMPSIIKAINSGRVILADDYLADGKTVVIDHGNGITSGYLHLSKSFVKTGDAVYRGQKIGIAGKTGATDAIHLHFFIKMDNGRTIIDPENFLRLFNK